MLSLICITGHYLYIMCIGNGIGISCEHIGLDIILKSHTLRKLINEKTSIYSLNNIRSHRILAVGLTVPAV